MKMELLSFWRLLLCTLDVLMFCSFFHAMFILKISKIKYAVYILTTTLIIVIVNSFGITWINLLALPVFYMLFSKLVFSISVSNSIVYTIIYYTVFAAGRESAFEILYRLLSAVTSYSIPQWFTPGAVPFLIIEYFVSFLFLLYIESYMKKLDIRGNDKFCWYLLIMPIASISIMISFMYMEFPDTRSIQIIMCGGAFLLYVSNAAIFIVLARFTQTMNQIKLSELNDLKVELERSNFERIERVNITYRKYLHDIHKYFNQFRSLAARGESQSIVRIVDELEGKMKADEVEEFYIGNPVLNSIFVEYVKRAREQEIKISIHAVEHLNVEFISDSDKISIFGNLLSNAIEAAAKCEKDKRRIDINLSMGNNYMLVFFIENTHINQLRKDGTRLLSTKRDDKAYVNHGLGIGNVKDLAKKYGGRLELNQMEDKFMAMLIISGAVKIKA